MIDKNIYKSRDDPLEFAKYELETFPDVLDSIQEAVKNKPLSHQKNWCGYNGFSSGGCACMGCINHEFLKVNLTKYHWKVWFKNFRPEEDYDEGKNSFGIILQNIQNHKKEVIKVLREVFQLSVPEISKIVKQESAIIIENMPYYETKHYFKKAQEYNSNLNLEMFYENPDNILNQVFVIPIKSINKIKP